VPRITGLYKHYTTLHHCCLTVDKLYDGYNTGGRGAKRKATIPLHYKYDEVVLF